MILSSQTEMSLRRLFGEFAARHGISFEEAVRLKTQVCMAVSEEFDFRLDEARLTARLTAKCLADVRVRDFILNAQEPHPN